METVALKPAGLLETRAGPLQRYKEFAAGDYTDRAEIELPEAGKFLCAAASEASALEKMRRAIIGQPTQTTR